MRSLFVPWSLAVFSSLVVAGNGFEEGRAAYERQKYAKAIEILRLLAEGGNADAQNIVGRMYSLGEGVTKDEGEAMKWMTVSAGNGNLEAQEAWAVLAIMEFYEKRQGVENKEEKIQVDHLFGETRKPGSYEHAWNALQLGERITNDYY